MVVVIPTIIQIGYEQMEPGPRSATCEQVKLDEWINWQKCWSDPYIGGHNEPRILAHPFGSQPIMFRLHSQATVGNLHFWWFFVCNRCRPILHLRGLHTERKEVEDRELIIPFVGPGPHEPRVQMWPALVEQNWARNREIDGQLGVDGYWSRPSSPTSSLGSDPWMGHFGNNEDFSD